MTRDANRSLDILQTELAKIQVEGDYTKKFLGELQTDMRDRMTKLEVKVDHLPSKGFITPSPKWQAISGDFVYGDSRLSLRSCGLLTACAKRKNSPVQSTRFYLSSPRGKNKSLRADPKSHPYFAHPVPPRGAYRDRYGRWVRDAVDAAVSTDE